MFDYLQQFNNLPKDLRDKISSPETMSAIAELEKKYQVDLAMAVMKIMIKSAAVKNLPAYFISDLNLSPSEAENLAKDLTAKVLLQVSDYLGLEKQVKALDLDSDINLIISEAALVLPSADLVNRFKSILSTYLKGIRSKIAARDAFSKPANIGGLNLSAEEIDRVFRICEQKTFKSLEVNLSAVSKITPPPSRLDKIIATADGTGAEYNLKQALASGQVKKVEFSEDKKNTTGKIIVPGKLDTKHELPVPERELDLPLPAKDETPKEKAPLNLPVAAIVTPVPTSPSPAIPKTSTPQIQQIQKPAKTGFFGQPLKETPSLRPAVTEAAAIRQIPKPFVKPIPAARPSSQPAKPVMQDIKPMPKVMGPLEELQYLDLINFRRLGKTPAEITGKVFSKIKLLEADGYDKMVAGVRAWRQSPVNRLYLKMVQEAMAKGQTIRDFALAAQKENKDYLSMEEIEAILAMNSQLVF